METEKPTEQPVVDPQQQVPQEPEHPLDRMDRMIRQAQAFMMVLTESSFEDSMVAHQVGLAILLDKPFIILASGSVQIPKNLQTIAGFIRRVDVTNESSMAEAQAAVGEYMKTLFKSKI